MHFVKIMYFDTPKTWILYKFMDCKKILIIDPKKKIITFFLYTPPSKILDCNFIMSRLVDIIFNLYKKCQILGIILTKVKNRGKKMKIA
jgi:hypothetical protein